MGWPEQKLAELCEVFADGDWIETKNQSPEGVRLIQTGNVGDGFFKERRDKARFISTDTFNALNCTEIFEGDCLVSRLPDPVGRSCLLPHLKDRMITAVDCTILRFRSDKLIPEFFNYFSQSNTYLKRVESLTSGATRKRISRKNLGIIEVPTPTIPEQKCIVAVLDKAFADIDRVRELTERNLQNARELFESYLQQVFSQRGEGCKIERLSEIVKFSGGGTPSKKNDDFWGGGIPWVSPKDMKADVIIDSKDKITNEAIENSSASFVKEGAILMVVRSGILARTIPVSIAGKTLTVNQDLKVLTPSKAIDSEYLYFYLKFSERFLLEKVSRGATVHRLTSDVLKNLMVTVPHLHKQKQAVEKCKILTREIQNVKLVHQHKLEMLDKLKKSFLQKAFSGELTKDDIGVTA